jgi:acetaldehyde dehydrogenase / alcohol dehydrogenase
MTIGTGYAGRSSVGENLRPDHLVNWVRLAHNIDEKVPMGDFAGLSPWRSVTGPVPAYPTPSNARTDDGPAPVAPPETGTAETGTDELREELRRIIIEELHDLIGGGRRG